MNAKKFSDAMSELDTKYVDEALNYKKKAKKPGWVKCCLLYTSVFNVTFKEENDGYTLSEFSRNEFIDLDFTPDMLRAANHLSNLFSIYDNLTITEDYLSGYGSLIYSAKTDNGYALWMDDGSTGYYDEFQFNAGDDEAGRVSILPVDTSSDWLDDYVVTWLLPDEKTYLTRLTCTCLLYTSRCV